MVEQRFTGKIIQLGDKTFLQVPFDPNQVWGAKPRHQITGTINNSAVRGSLTGLKDGFALPLGPAWLRGTPLAEGQEVEVVLSPEGPQVDKLPMDLSAALIGEPEAKEFFESLSTFYRKGYLRWVDGTKNPTTRAERIHELIALLKAGKKQR